MTLVLKKESMSGTRLRLVVHSDAKHCAILMKNLRFFRNSSLNRSYDMALSLLRVLRSA